MSEDGAATASMAGRSMVDRVPGLVWMTGSDDSLCFANHAWLTFTGHASGGPAPPTWADVLHPDDRERCLALHRTVLAAGEEMPVEYRLRHRRDGWRWVAERIALAPASDGGPGGLIGCAADIDEHRRLQEELCRALDERNALLAELLHRVRNTVQMIASMLIFQARRAGGAEAARLLGRSARRVRTMGMAQERLFARADPSSRVDLGRYLTDLAGELVAAGERGVTLETEIEELTVLPGTAAPLGFMVGELVANALQHAFPPEAAGAVRLELRRRGGVGELVVGDDGVGLPPGMWPRDTQSASARVGMSLLSGLAKQARARIELESGDATRFRITFPLS